MSFAIACALLAVIARSKALGWITAALVVIAGCIAGG